MIIGRIVSDMATQEEKIVAGLFLSALFPLLKVVMSDNPKMKKKFDGVNASVQFVARDSDGDIGAYFKFTDGRLDIIQGICEKPDIAFVFGSVKKMNAMLAGKPAVPWIKGFFKIGLLLKVMSLLMNLTILMPTARPTDPEKKRLKVKLTIYMMAASLSQFNKLGNPEIRKWTSKQPERIYQFSVGGGEDIAAYLRIKAGQTQAGPGIYTKRHPFVHMKFKSVDDALPIIHNEANMVQAVEKGYLSLEGSPEYARDIGVFMMQIQSLIM
jgi:hypothetical protein